MITIQDNMGRIWGLKGSKPPTNALHILKPINSDKYDQAQ